MKYGVAMNTYGVIVPKLSSIRNTTKLSKAARQRLKWLDFYASHGRNARLTCRHFGISPDVFYRWKKRYRSGSLSSLEDSKSRRPHTVRAPQTDPATVSRIKQLRELYPRWGKKNLHAMLQAESLHVSEATVGRVLTRLRAKGQLHEPAIVTAKFAGKKRRTIFRRPYAIRRDWGFIPKNPGDLIQLDTLHIYRPDGGGKRYQFTASDYISKHTARMAANVITSTAASGILDVIAERMPVPPKLIQVDGGSEFMKVFEAACASRGIRLFVLPPHSPKLNGVVERMNRTSREEIYDLALHVNTTIEEHNQLLKEQDYIYNYIRPHEALGLITPAAYYESIRL